MLSFEISKHAICLAEKMKKAFSDKGYKFFVDSPTNQQFVIVDNEKMRELEKDVVFSMWEKFDDTHTVLRFATSWSTTNEDVERLIKLI